VNERILLAVFMALAPATTLDGRFPDEWPGVPRLKLGGVLRFGKSSFAAADLVEQTGAAHNGESRSKALRPRYTQRDAPSPRRRREGHSDVP
jgi:hypothetical protein